MTDKGFLCIIGCGIKKEDFPEEGRKILAEASVIAGSRTLLSLFAPEGKEQLVIAANAQDAAEQLARRSATEKIAVLASGDSLFHGIAGTFAKFLEPEKYTVRPNITAFQYFLAKLGKNWSDTALFSIHAKDTLVPWRRILAAKSAVIYCDNKINAARAAAALIKRFPEAAKRMAAVGIALGSVEEKIIGGTLESIAEDKTEGISLLALFESDNISETPALPLGLEDEYYIHENNMITHPEIRAVILSKLRLRPGVMWDLGAGSGSVGIEAAGLCSGLKVFSIEKSQERFEHLKTNIAREGLDNVHPLHGDILKEIAGLEAPDFIFAGGGGPDIKTIIEKSFSRLKKGGSLIAAAVTVETYASLVSALPESRSEILTMNISRSHKLPCSTMMKAENMITLFVYRKEKNTDAE